MPPEQVSTNRLAARCPDEPRLRQRGETQTIMVNNSTLSPEPGTDEWNSAMNVRLRRYGSRAARVWGYIGIGIILVVVLWLLGFIGDAIKVLLLGGITAFIYAPIVNWLDKRWHIPRLLGTIVGLVVLFAAVSLLFAAMMPPLTEQFLALVNAVPGYVSLAQNAWSDLVAYFDTLDPSVLAQINAWLSELGDTVQKVGADVASTVGKGLLVGVSSTVSAVVSFFMALVVSFWLAKDFPRMEREFSIIMGPRIGEDYRIVTSVFGRSLGGYLKGLLITSSCTGVIAGVGFWILGVPYSGLLGLVTAVLNVIPYIGPWIGGALAFLVGLTVGWLPALLSIVVTVCAQQFTDTFVSPKVMQSAVSLHPVLVIIALLGGGAVGGIIGMIAAVPLTAAVKGVFVYYFEKKTGRQLVSREGALFKGDRFCDEQGNPRPACDALGVDIAGDKGVPPRIKEELDRERADRAHRDEEERSVKPGGDGVQGDGLGDQYGSTRQDDSARL